MPPAPRGARLSVKMIVSVHGSFYRWNEEPEAKVGLISDGERLGGAEFGEGNLEAFAWTFDLAVASAAAEGEGADEAGIAVSPES